MTASLALGAATPTRTALARRARRLIARAGGRYAITWWTWLVTAPLALTVMSGLQYVAGGLWAALAVASVEHVGVGALLLAGWALLRVVPARLRAAAVVVIFAGIGVLRPLLFLAAGRLLGIPVTAGDLGGRIMINLVTTVAVFSLIAVAAELVIDHLGVYRRLRSAREASARDAGNAAERVRQLREAALGSVLAELERTAAEAADHAIHPAEAAALLRELAEGVVRPASHRVFATDSVPECPSGAAGPFRVRDWIASVFGEMQAAPPLSLALLFAVLVLPFGIWQYGLFFCLLPLACGLLVMWGANALLARLSSRAAPVWRLPVLLVGYASAGVLLSQVSEVTVTLLGGDPDLVWYQAVSYWVVGLGVAFVASLASRVRRDQSELEAAVQHNIQAAAAVRNAFERERAELARLLHSGVQSELIASALALSAEPSADASAELRSVVEKIRAELNVPRFELGAATRLAVLVESWGSAIPLQSSFGDGVWERLEEPGRAEAVVDAISEGLANAVRHGDGTQVTLEVRPGPGGGVSVIVVSGGVLSPALSPALSPDVAGIGLRQLTERGDVVLRQTPAGVELTVAIP